MIRLLWSLLAGPARADDDEAVLAPPPAADLHRRLAPARVDFRVPFRPDVGPGTVAALGFQVWRTRTTAYDLDIAYASGRQILVPGPLRSWLGLDVGLQSETAVGRWLGIGGVGGFAVRDYRQQGADIAQGFVPYLGARVGSTLIATRRWSLVVSGRLTSDLALTRLVFEDARTMRLSPFEAQLGFRFAFARRRAALVKETR